MKISKKINLSIIAAGLLVLLFSYYKFSYCVNSNFSGVSVTSHGCYSDIPIFWNTHLLEAHLWPYKQIQIPEVNQVINPVEYPFLTGFFMWLLSYVTPNADQYGVNFFKINTLIIGIFFIICLNFIRKPKKSKYFYFAAAPAVIFSLLINWDVLAVAPMLGAIYYFDNEKYKRSSLLLAISISFKFFPAVLIIPIFILGLTGIGLKKVFNYIALTACFFLLINLPAAIYNFDGWFYFYKFSINRGFGSGSIWEILKLSGIDLKGINFLYFSSTLLVFIFFVLYMYKIERSVKLADVAFYFTFAFVIFNKVYSPQYVIWLTSLAVLVLNTNRQKIFFFIWQLGELVYHFAIWQYLYWQGYGLHSAGVSENSYKFVSIARIVTSISFTLSLIYPNLKAHRRAGGDERI